MLSLEIRDVESKDFSFDSQLPIPKIVKESDSQRPRTVELPFHILIFCLTPSPQNG